MEIYKIVFGEHKQCRENNWINQLNIDIIELLPTWVKVIWNSSVRKESWANTTKKMIEKSLENSARNGPERNSSSAIAPISTSLPDSVLEKLLSSYSLKQKRSALVVFLAASILFDIWAIFVPQGQSTENLGKHTWFIHYVTHTHTRLLNQSFVSCWRAISAFVELTKLLFHTYLLYTQRGLQFYGDLTKCGWW